MIADPEAFMEELSKAIDRQHAAEKVVRMMEMNALLSMSAPSTASDNAIYIEANRDVLYEEDIEFLSKDTRSFQEIADYRKSSATANKVWLKKHCIEAVKIDGVARKQIPTLPVFKAHTGERR